MGAQGWALEVSVCYRQVTFTFGTLDFMVGLFVLLIIFLRPQPWGLIKGQTTDKGFSILTKLLASLSRKYWRWCSWRAKKDNGTS